MKEIKCLYTNIRDEMEDAEKYADLALKYKDEDRELADTFASLSKQEVTHAEAPDKGLPQQKRGAAGGHESRVRLGT